MFKTVVLPAQSSFNTIMSYKPQGIFLSNGPGDPFATGEYAKPTIKKLQHVHELIFCFKRQHHLMTQNKKLRGSMASEKILPQLYCVD